MHDLYPRDMDRGGRDDGGTGSGGEYINKRRLCADNSCQRLLSQFRSYHERELRLTVIVVSETATKVVIATSVSVDTIEVDVVAIISIETAVEVVKIVWVVLTVGVVA